MSNLINRQDAIDALNHMCSEDENEITVSRANVNGMLRALPSAQPEQSFGIQDIFEYLDTVLHPIISPDHWSVYSELHDMISMLPSAQPEQQWILVTERLPNKDGLYLVTTSKGQVQTHVFNRNGNSEEYWRRCNKAWMPLPKPHTEK